MKAKIFANTNNKVKCNFRWKPQYYFTLLCHCWYKCAVNVRSTQQTYFKCERPENIRVKFNVYQHGKNSEGLFYILKIVFLLIEILIRPVKLHWSLSVAWNKFNAN